MEIYLVGGAVRDELLDLPVKDRDWVVVGATPEQMQALGYRQVGADFPVFIHPQSGEEYALARTERKQGHGYHGFSVYSAPDVTLEEDLLRRDLTINAMARASDGTLVDPFGGRNDLEQRHLRHVSEAFAEDPLRILRTARFAARFHDLGFRVSEETMALMRQMVAAGEVDHLVPERVWQELQRALHEHRPRAFFEVLDQCGALAVLIPELAQASVLDAAMEALECVAGADSSTDMRLAALLSPLFGTRANALASALKAPNDCQDLVRLTAAVAPTLTGTDPPGAESLLGVLETADAWRRPERFGRLLEVCACLPGGPDHELLARIQGAAGQARDVNPRQLMARGYQGRELGEAIRQERLEILKRWSGDEGSRDNGQ